MKYFATCELRCGKRDKGGRSVPYFPGEEIDCDEKLGKQLVADGHAITDSKLADAICDAREEKDAEEAELAETAEVEVVVEKAKASAEKAKPKKAAPKKKGK